MFEALKQATTFALGLAGFIGGPGIIFLYYDWKHKKGWFF